MTYPSKWKAIKAIATKVATTAETLRDWIRQTTCDTGQRLALPNEEQQQIKALVAM